MGADPNCVTMRQGEQVAAQHSVVNDNGTLRWVFVYVREWADGSLPSGEGESVVLEQTGCMFEPHVFGIEAGATLRIVNSDPTLRSSVIIRAKA